jgi:hypothetical protein
MATAGVSMIHHVPELKVSAEVRIVLMDGGAGLPGQLYVCTF